MRGIAPAAVLAAALAAPMVAAAIAAGAALAAAEPAAKTIGAATRPPHYCPRGDTDGFNANRLIGKRLPHARDLARTHDCTLRVVKRDGEALIVTLDFSPTRIDVAVRGKRVTGIDGIY
jgi:hypothetical protein